MRVGRRRICWSLAVLGFLVVLAWVTTRFLQSGDRRDAARVVWSESPEPDADLGYRFRPHSELWTAYPGNPRGYFAAASGGDEWVLKAMEGSEALLGRTEGSGALLRVEPVEAASEVAWHMQLHLSGIPIRRGERHRLSFRARSAGPRPIEFGVQQAHEPWKNLGLHGRVMLTPFWQTFDENFTASAAEDEARIQFNLGGSRWTVELADVRLWVLPKGRILVPRQRFRVRYQFDALGCRDGASAPIQTGRVRILVLGGGAAMGIGVH